MTLDVLLIGPSGHGGEGVYVGALHEHPPEGVAYDVSDDFHRSAQGATCVLPVEVGLNKLLRPQTYPDMGFRALRLRRSYDVVHAHAHPVWLRGLRGAPLVMSEGSSAAVYLTDYLGWDEGRMRRAFSRSRRLYRALGVRDRLLALEHAARLYVFSEWARQVNIRWGVAPEKIEVIAPGFDEPPAAARIERETFTFLFVGSDFERKGGYDVVDAFHQIAAELPHARLLIVGSDESKPNPDLLIRSWVGPQRRAKTSSLLASMVTAGVAKRLTWVDGPRLQQVFREADAFVMPTHAEGFGFTNVEAMSFGLPVITSTVGPAEEIVTADQTGLLVSAGDVEALARAMHRLAGSPDQARSMGAAGRAAFQARFTRQAFRENLLSLYKRVLEAG